LCMCVISERKRRQCEKVSGCRMRGEELLCYCAEVRGLPCCLAMPCLNASPPSTIDLPQKTCSSHPPAKPEWAAAAPWDEHSPVATSHSRVLTLLLERGAIRHTRQWKSRIPLTDGVAVVFNLPMGYFRLVETHALAQPCRQPAAPSLAELTCLHHDHTRTCRW
jgi:hypothetical protein